MASKSVTPVYQVFTAASMSGTATIYSAVTAIIYRDAVCYQMNWTGNPVGTFAVQGSLDYASGLPQNMEPPGGQNSGTWNSLSLSPTPTAGSGSSTYLIDMFGLSFPFVRLAYTNTSSQGSLTAYVSGKSLGV